MGEISLQCREVGNITECQAIQNPRCNLSKTPHVRSDELEASEHRPVVPPLLPPILLLWPDTYLYSDMTGARMEQKGKTSLYTELSVLCRVSVS